MTSRQNGKHAYLARRHARALDLIDERMRLLIAQYTAHEGCSITEMSRRIPITHVTLVNVRAQKVHVGIDLVGKIVGSLGVRADFFFDAHLGTDPDYRDFLGPATPSGAARAAAERLLKALGDRDPFAIDLARDLANAVINAAKGVAPKTLPADDPPSAIRRKAKA
jgi:hypothetical protein